jgi:hypothetical protein
VADEFRVGEAISVPHGVARASLFDIDYSAVEGKWIYVNVSRNEGCAHFEKLDRSNG